MKYSFLLLSTAFLCADDTLYLNSLDTRIQTLENEPNPSARPYVKHGVDLYFVGDLLYWAVGQGGIPVGIIQDGPATLSNATVRELPTRMSWGFRVGIGYNLPYAGWDLYLSWLRINGHTDVPADQTPLSGQLFYPIWLNPLSSNADLSVTSWNAHWRTRLNLLDLALGREFFTSPSFLLRPSVGLRYVWVRQRLQINYTSFEGNPTTNSTVNDNNKYSGLGIRAGIDANYKAIGPISLYANFGLSLIAGFFSNTNVQLDFTEGTFTPYTYLTNHFDLGTAITDISLGIRYHQLFGRDRYSFMLQLGWEQQLFFSQNQLARFTSATTYTSNLGDLTYQGLTLSARYDF